MTVVLFASPDEEPGRARSRLNHQKRRVELNKLLTHSVTSCCLAAAWSAFMTIPVRANDRDTTTQVNGVISKIETGRISVATAWGRMSLHLKASAHAKVGDEITVWVNENNVVIDAYPKGRQGHITGGCVAIWRTRPEIKKTITLSTSGGRTRLEGRNGIDPSSGIPEGRRSPYN